MPADARANVHRATDDLRRSGILDAVLQPGERAPEFALANQDEDAAIPGAASGICATRRTIL